MRNQQKRKLLELSLFFLVHLDTQELTLIASLTGSLESYSLVVIQLLHVMF